MQGYVQHQWFKVIFTSNNTYDSQNNQMQCGHQDRLPWLTYTNASRVRGCLTSCEIVSILTSNLTCKTSVTCWYSCSTRFVFISLPTSALLTEDVHGFPQSLHANVGTVRLCIFFYKLQFIIRILTSPCLHDDSNCHQVTMNAYYYVRYGYSLDQRVSAYPTMTQNPAVSPSPVPLKILVATPCPPRLDRAHSPSPSRLSQPVHKM
jgi:hypothetical protein